MIRRRHLAPVAALAGAPRTLATAPASETAALPNAASVGGSMVGRIPVEEFPSVKRGGLR